MFCPMCGAPNEDDATYCGNCGAALTADAPPLETPGVGEPVPPAEMGADLGPVPEEPSIPPPARPLPPLPPLPPRPIASTVPANAPVNGMAVASLVLGIAGLSVLPLISSIFAVIFGYMARREIRQRPSETSGDGLALAGIVLGWIGVAGLVLAILGVAGFTICGLCGAFGSSGTP